MSNVEICCQRVVFVGVVWLSTEADNQSSFHRHYHAVIMTRGMSDSTGCRHVSSECGWSKMSRYTGQFAYVHCHCLSGGCGVSGYV